MAETDGRQVFIVRVIDVCRENRWRKRRQQRCHRRALVHLTDNKRVSPNTKIRKLAVIVFPYDRQRGIVL